MPISYGAAWSHLLLRLLVVFALIILTLFLFRRLRFRLWMLRLRRRLGFRGRRPWLRTIIGRRLRPVWRGLIRISAIRLCSIRLRTIVRLRWCRMIVTRRRFGRTIGCSIRLRIVGLGTRGLRSPTLRTIVRRRLTRLRMVRLGTIVWCRLIGLRLIWLGLIWPGLVFFLLVNFRGVR